MNECHLNVNGIIPFLIQGRGQIHIRRRPLANRSGVQDQHIRPRPTGGGDRGRGEGRLGEQGIARQARAQREPPFGDLQRGT